ncbi:MAG: CRISPR-associated endonuclease Cas3'', partial [Bacteroidetes bacterium]|nr:CRISPR-associated endonuclease Cas3'' [Bacteroidota bacterium]
MTEWLAHSKGKNPPVPVQTYYKHISEVLRRAEKNVKSLSPYYKVDLDFFREAIRAAAIFHDLGKLDDENQKVLSKGGGKGLPINHIEAGTAWLLKNKMGRSSILVHSHHAYQPHYGIPSIPAELAKEEFCLRDKDVMIHTEQKLNEYISKHAESGLLQLKEINDSPTEWNGLTLRVALSCLVDADHGDTANNYGKEFSISRVEPKWEKRLESLDRYVAELGKKNKLNKRNQIRKEIYEVCRKADTNPSFYACDSPVGTGKTTAVMAHLLKTAIDKKLRHIIVVLPYTNI